MEVHKLARVSKSTRRAGRGRQKGRSAPGASQQFMAAAFQAIPETAVITQRHELIGMIGYDDLRTVLTLPTAWPPWCRRASSRTRPSSG